MSTSLIYHTQGLREYKYLSTEYVDSKIRIYIEYKEELTCIDCGSHNVSAVKIKTRAIKGVPMGTTRTIFIVTIQRLRCHVKGCKNYWSR